MTLEEFLNKRRNKQFTIEDVESILGDLGYRTELLDTYCKPNDDWGNGSARQFKNKLLDEVGETYFAYIKFYISSDNKIYALVAGKTNSWNDDVHFRYKDGLKDIDDVIFERTDKAKKWLVAKQKENKKCRWYHEKVLIVQLNKKDEKVKDKTKKKENLAYSIEEDIGGLLGLFNS